MQLTSKQKEMMQIQLEKEAAIRKRLHGVRDAVRQEVKSHWLMVFLSCCCRLQLDMELQSVVGLLEAALLERPPLITRELPAVLQALMPLLHSPLAAPRIQQAFLDAGVCLMPKHLRHLGTRLLLIPGPMIEHNLSIFTDAPLTPAPF